MTEEEFDAKFSQFDQNKNGKIEKSEMLLFLKKLKTDSSVQPAPVKVV